MRSGRWIALAFVAIVLAYAAFRIFVHSSHLLQPALVTPQMDARQALSPSLDARLKRLLHDRVGYERGGRPKLIALTFDDGPYPIFTPLLLDELKRLGVHATFFLIGRDAEQWPELTRRIRSDGNEIADHTYSHPNLDQESPAAVRSEILRGRDVLWSLSHDLGTRKFFRPPHGRYSLSTVQVVQSLGYHLVLWTDDAGDWRTVSTQTLAGHLERYATAPEIVLLHSGRLRTVQALPEVVGRFRKAGYHFVTVGELLQAVPPLYLNHPAKHPV
ncbi:MAG: polysaccharide deacetylase family protein [Candidatus Eremiobacteraeota bacterium]|nr:polysaccharide deacetylase family protein [Candidatus Eremiobacteraeota bacterium]